MIALCTERGFAIAAITRAFWGDDPRAYLLFLASVPGAGLIGDGVRLTRAVDEWRRARGAVSLHFGEDTGVNFEPIARRLGADRDRPSYVIRGGAATVAAPAPLDAGRGATLLDRMLTSPHLFGGPPPLKLVEHR